MPNGEIVVNIVTDGKCVANNGETQGVVGMQEKQHKEQHTRSNEQ